jgi:hypothetical protein
MMRKCIIRAKLPPTLFKRYTTARKHWIQQNKPNIMRNTIISQPCDVLEAGLSWRLAFLKEAFVCRLWWMMAPSQRDKRRFSQRLFASFLYISSYYSFKYHMQ